MPKYFEVSGASRKPGGFDWISIGVIGGCMFGVYEAVAPAEIVKLDAMAKDPAAGVEEVTAQYFQSKTGRPLFTPPPAPPKEADVLVPKSDPPKQIKGNGKTIVVENSPIPDPVDHSSKRDLKLDEVLKAGQF